MESKINHTKKLTDEDVEEITNKIKEIKGNELLTLCCSLAGFLVEKGSFTKEDLFNIIIPMNKEFARKNELQDLKIK